MPQPLYTSTTWELPGYRIDRSIGMCWGIMINSVGFARGISGSFKSLKAGEVTEYTESVDHARHIAVERMMEHASSLGGNAVVGVRFDSTKTAGGGNDQNQNGPVVAEVMAYGTAVVAVPVGS